MKARPNKGRSIIDFPKEYVCIDIETTGLDFEYDEIIEVVAVRVVNGEITGSFSSLVRPLRSHALLTGGALKEYGVESFSDLPHEKAEEFGETHLVSNYIEDLTGIKNEELLEAPYAADVMEEFCEFAGNSVLVGHNVNFDINFLYDACERLGLTLSNDFVDTMRISRKVLPDLEHHRLSDIVAALGIADTVNHRGLSDAENTAKCYETLKKKIAENESLDDFKKSFLEKHEKYAAGLAAIEATVSEFDETNPIFGKTVVFTGALSSMGRKEAFQIVANFGGTPADSITKKTNFLVVGNEDFAKSVKDGATSKMKKAEKYRQEGLDIVTLSENTFFEMIDYTP